MFLSLILALLLAAMLVQYFVITNNTDLQSATNIYLNPRLAADKQPDKQLDIFKKLKQATTAGRDSTVSDADSGFEVKHAFTQKPNANRIQVSESDNHSFLFIYGLVTDINGQPLANVVVKHDDKPDSVRTDSNGVYRVSVKRLEKNYPVLIFLKSGYKRKITRVVESDIKSENKIAVNVTMAFSSETITVNGWVGESNGTSIKGEVVKLVSLSEGLYYSARSDTAGNIIFEGIERGVNYKVDIRPSEKYKKIASEYLTITDHSMPLFITLEPVSLVNIEGVITDSHGGSVKNLKFNIRSDTNSSYDVQLISDELGRFKLSGFPMGQLSFTTRSPKYFKVTGLDLSQLTYTNLVIPVDVGPHQISGWVRNQHGFPIKDARAVLDAEFKFGGLNSSSIRTYVTDNTGYFEFTDLGPGEHYLTVYAKGFINQGVSYDTSSRVDQLHLVLSQWSDSLTSKEPFKFKIHQASANVNRVGGRQSSIDYVTEASN